MIKIEHLTKQLPAGQKVLDDINLQVHPGEFIAVLGGSGSGKSMLLKCMAMQEEWTSGSYKLEGVDVRKKGLAGKAKVRREFAYLAETPMLNPNRSALKNVLVGTRHQTPWWRMLTGMVRSDDYMGAMDVLEKLGLLDKAHTKAEHLSGGEKQRVAIARALVHGAKVILADEPVTGLDPHSAEKILKDLKALCSTQGITIVTVLTQADWAERFADRLVGLSGGDIVFDITGRRLMQREKMML
ncbi:phosphonate ABC transporter ATP-binding protein [Paenibacillus tarimensis]|uniref:phosphonate ABC transporter ATP-binding protein n=1 Tax=Paenibacillus tarimensis TaxID=416012 RepID=UPI001F37D0FD|nr:ATP-binding cassette domain-containing protein [Paenibacillus tarimensis]MCF2942714.1 ATP-binding cassette domain-containing protein [Paenibacillus tarimensis]